MGPFELIGDGELGPALSPVDLKLPGPPPDLTRCYLWVSMGSDLRRKFKRLFLGLLLCLLCRGGRMSWRRLSITGMGT